MLEMGCKLELLYLITIVNHREVWNMHVNSKSLLLYDNS